MIKKNKTQRFPISKKTQPKGEPWERQNDFFLEKKVDNKHTKRNYRLGMRTFADWLMNFSNSDYRGMDSWPLSPKKLETAVVKEYYTFLSEEYNVSTVQVRMHAVIKYFEYLADENQLPSSLDLRGLKRLHIKRDREAKNIREKKIKEKSPGFKKRRKAIGRLLDYFDSFDTSDIQSNRDKLIFARDKALFHFFASSDAKAADLLNLDRGDLEYANLIDIEVPSKIKGVYTLSLETSANKMLEDYLSNRDDNDSALFVTHNSNNRITDKHVRRRLEKWRKIFGITEKITLSDFRVYRLKGLPENLELPIQEWNFISDPLLKKILHRDYRELNNALKVGIQKSSVVLCGSIFEACFNDILNLQLPKAEISYSKLFPKKRSKKLDRWSLEELISVAHDLQIIRIDTANFAGIIRDFRNLIHPMAELRKKYRLSPEVLSIISNLLVLVLRDIENYYKNLVI